MLGVILFWLHYIVAFILFWHILCCVYVKEVKIDRWDRTFYERTENDSRLKYPLWLILIFIGVLCVPILNIIVFVPYLLFRSLCEAGENKNPYYIKSIFTKKL